MIDETPAAYKAIDARDGGAGRPGRGRAHAAPGGVREGVISMHVHVGPRASGFGPPENPTRSSDLPGRPEVRGPGPRTPPNREAP